MKKFVTHYTYYWGDSEPENITRVVYGKDWDSVQEEVKSHTWDRKANPKDRWSKDSRQEFDHYEEFEVEYKEVYYYMTSEDVGVNECEDGFGGTEYSEEITDWQKSKYYDTFDECFLDWVKCNPEDKTPIMKGVIEK